VPSRTLVAFHAHPDDEAIATGGTIARAVAEGHRVVLVVATKGEQGEVDDGVLDAGETLGARRVVETERAAAILGIARVEFLGYQDSGMMGEPTNDAPGSFWSADIEEAAARLATVLREEAADALTVYDEHGVYGHPDHVQVHRVGVRAAELAATPLVYETTLNRDHLMRLGAERREDMPEGVELPDVDTIPDLGTPESLITTHIDVVGHIDQKRAALAAHATQVDDTHWFLALPLEWFREAFGTEWMIRRGAPPGTHEDRLFAPLDDDG